MSSIRFFIFSIIQFLIIYSLEATLNSNLDITKRCTNQPKLVSKTIPTKKLSKWLEEDNRKQFELIHKLWRKTNIFLEVKASTTPKPLKSTNGKQYQTKPSAERHLHTKRSSTPSFFEFYYRDELDPKSIRNKKKNIYEDRNRTNKNKKRFQDTTKSKFHKHPLKDSDDTSNNNKHALLPTTPEIKDHVTKLKFFDTFDNFFLQRRPELTAKLQKLPTDSKASCTSRYVFDSFFDRSDLRLKRNTTNDENSSHNETNATLIFMPTQMRNITKIIDLSTLYDKINFFEMYDDGTKNADDNLEEIESNKKDFIRNLTKFFKTDDYEEVSVKTDSTKASETFNNLKYINEPMEKYKDYKSDKINRDLKDLTSWEDYPFAAVYIYKPLKVYCDAAALSSHWIITSAHCLSQTHNNKLYGKTHSAYVTYCGPSWKEPGRISYVKDSVIHPKFNTNDEERKYLYNVGVVQVVTPLSTCPGWAPVLMASHQFIPTNEASTVTTIGWGLDRFKGKLSSTELTKQRQLFSVNTSSVTSGHCIPERLWAKQDVNTNVYCLRRKEEGHVRGSLMMYQGRLVALYLQESVPEYEQYTGLLKIVPWLYHMIKEEDSKDDFFPYD